MDIPYIALLWNPLDPDQARRGQTVHSRLSRRLWRPRLERPGLVLLTRTSAGRQFGAHVLRGTNGILLGTVFSRSSTRALTQEEILGADDLAVPPDEVIENLTRDYWGGFIAILSSPHRGDWRVYRECSASIPCYYTTLNGLVLVTSDARHIYSRSDWDNSTGPPVPIAVNWNYLKKFLADGQFQGRSTALTAVQELMAGETLSGGRTAPSVKISWDPTRFADQTLIGSLESKSEELHATVRFCIEAWGREHNWILHSLSGGFDSSLVLSVLAKLTHRPQIVCINRYGAGPAEDERDYARLAASHVSVPLIECAWEFDRFTFNEACLHTPMGAKPNIQSLLYPHEAAYVARLESVQHFDAMWTGEGGDHLLIAYPMKFGVTDFLAVRGMCTGILPVIKDAARLTGTSIPILFRDAICQRLHTRFTPHFVTPSRRMHDLASDAEAQHPWISRTRRLPPGKQEQIMLLLELLHRHPPIPGSLNSISHHPLISQPLIEFCLRVPTYDLLCDGRSRGLARRAFSRSMPTDIIERETKGETTHSLAGVLHRSAQFVTEFLLDGVLTQHNLLDKTLLESIKPSHITAHNDALLPICAALAAEAWARIWSPRPFL